MEDKLTIELDGDVMAALSRLAEANGHTVGEEAKAILRRNIRPRVSQDRREIIERFRRIRAMTPLGATQTSAAQLIREDRDR